MVLTFAPTRHGHSLQVPKPRLAMPHGTSVPQIFAAAILPLRTVNVRTAVVDRDRDGADLLRDGGPFVTTRGRESDAALCERADGRQGHGRCGEEVFHWLLLSNAANVRTASPRVRQRLVNITRSFPTISFRPA